RILWRDLGEVAGADGCGKERGEPRVDPVLRVADADHKGVRAELIDDLAARAAGRGRKGSGGIDGDGLDRFLSGRYRGEDGGSLGAVAEAVRGVLDVAAGVD